MYTSVFHSPPPPSSGSIIIIIFMIFFLSDPYVKVTFVDRGGDHKVYNLDGQKTHVAKKVSLSLSLSLRFLCKIMLVY